MLQSTVQSTVRTLVIFHHGRRTRLNGRRTRLSLRTPVYPAPLRRGVTVSSFACSVTSLFIHAHLQALKAAAEELNQLACDDVSTGSSGNSASYDGISLPSLFTLPDDPAVLAKSAAPMVVLIQTLCERGTSYQSVRALHACYLEPSLAPFEVVWLTLQAAGLAAQHSQVFELLDAVLLSKTVPEWLTPERTSALLRLGILHVVPQVCEASMLYSHTAK